MKPEFKYHFTKRQIKNVKGWEITFCSPSNPNWGDKIGFFTTLKEAKRFVLQHQNEMIKNWKMAEV